MTAIDYNEPEPEVEVYDEVELDQVAKLDRKMRALAKNVDQRTGRILVDTYYQFQHNRIAFNNQVDAMERDGEDPEIVRHFYEQTFALEKQMASILKVWSENHPVGQWAMSQKGIGPVLSSALLAYVDMDRTPHQSSLWSLAGLRPDVVWLSQADVRKAVKELESTYEMQYQAKPDTATLAGLLADKMRRNPTTLGRAEDREDLIKIASRRPYSAPLKVICWRIGASFVRVSKHPDAYYGKKYRGRKAYEVARNERGGNAEWAAKILQTKNITSKSLKATLESGKLPPAQIDQRARRWTVKLYLAQWWEVAYEHHTGEKAPFPYPIQFGGHAEWEPAPR
jgi:hypothetical protein